MAEKLDQRLLSDQLAELEEEIMYLENAKRIKKRNDEMAALVSQLKDTKSTIAFIVDHRIELRKRLKSPNVPNAIPVKYKQQEKFVTCCQKLPQVIDFLELLRRKENVYNFLNSEDILSRMEKEMQFGKEYSNHIKYFLSSTEGAFKNIKETVTLFHGKTEDSECCK